MKIYFLLAITDRQGIYAKIGVIYSVKFHKMKGVISGLVNAGAEETYTIPAYTIKFFLGIRCPHFPNSSLSLQFNTVLVGSRSRLCY